MTENLRSVRIDRIVLRGVDLDLHDAAQLPRLVEAQLRTPSRSEPETRPVEGTATSIAGAIARRVIAEPDQPGGRA